jgi:uncharacterized protein YndB with AHSA1/START domain
MSEKEKTEAGHDQAHALYLSRDYDFSRETVFGMFVDEKKAAKFWGPAGAVKDVFEFDARPGGAIRVHDRNNEGFVAKTSGTVTQVVVPELIEFRSSTAIGEGTAPFDVIQTIRFEALGPKKTRVTIHVRILDVGGFPGGAISLEGGFMGGWGETLGMLQRDLR